MLQWGSSIYGKTKKQTLNKKSLRIIKKQVVRIGKKKFIKQAGAELGQAQPKLWLDFTSTNFHWIARQLVLLY